MRNVRGAWVGAAVVALSMAACGGGEGTTGSGGAGGGSGGAGTGGNPGPSCEGQPDTLDLAGTWAALGALTVSVKGQPGGLVTICPADQEGQANLTLLVTIGQDSANPTKLVDVRATLCTVELPAVTAVVGACEPGTEAAVTTQISATEALLAALPSLTASTVGGTLGGTEIGSDITFEKFVVTAGSSETGENLPTWDPKAPGCDAFDLGHSNVCEAKCVANCAGLEDSDGDGYPGVTLDVCGRTQDDEGQPCNAADPTTPGVTIQGRAFAALEVDPQFTGTATSSCELRGTVDSSVSYSVVGADVALAGSQISVASALDALPSLVVKPADSKLTMVRVDGKYATTDLKLDPTDPLAACKIIIAKRNELF